MIFMLLYLIQLENQIPKIDSAIPFDTFFTKTYEVMPAAAPDEALLSEVQRVVLFQDHLIILCRDNTKSVKAFNSKTGAFIQSISQKGSGPGEFTRADDIFVYNGKLLILDNLDRKIIFFNEDLSHFHDQKIPDMTHGAVQSCGRLGSSPTNELFLMDIFSRQSQKACALLQKDAVTFFGDITPAQKTSGWNGGGAFVSSDAVYYLGALDANLQILDRKTGAVSTKPMALPVWPVVKADEIADFYKQSTPQDDNKLFAYLRKNLMPVSMSHSKGWLVIDFGAFLIAYHLQNHQLVPIQYKHGYGVIGNTRDAIVYAVDDDQSADTNPKIIMYSASSK